jgi:hypothetical protein
MNKLDKAIDKLGEVFDELDEAVVERIDESFLMIATSKNIEDIRHIIFCLNKLVNDVEKTQEKEWALR